MSGAGEIGDAAAAPSGDVHPVFGPVLAGHLPVLLAGAAALLRWSLAGNAAWQGRALGDLAALAGAEVMDRVPPAAPSRAALDAAGRALAGQLGAVPMLALVAAPVADPGRQAAGQRLSAWVLAAALRRQRLTPGQGAIRAGLEATRRMKARRPEALGRLGDLPLTFDAVVARVGPCARGGRSGRRSRGVANRARLPRGHRLPARRGPGRGGRDPPRLWAGGGFGRGPFVSRPARAWKGGR